MKKRSVVLPRIILHLKDGSDGVLALRSAQKHLKDRPEWPECIYGYADGSNVFVRTNKASITAYEEGVYA